MKMTSITVLGTPLDDDEDDLYLPDSPSAAIPTPLRDDLFLSESPSTVPTPSRTSSSTPGPPGPLRSLSKPQSVAAQIEEFSIRDTRHLTIETLPRIRFAGKRFFLHSWLPRRHKLRSFIGDHGHSLIEVNGNTLGNAFWLCGHCDRRGRTQGCLFAQRATSAAISHLRIQHSVTKAGSPDSSSSAASAVLASLQAHAKSPAADTTAFGAVDEFKAAFIHWVVESNIPLSAVRHDTFQRLLRTPNHIINAALPTHHSTVKAWIMDDFKASQKLIQRQLRAAKSAIHLSFDAWTSPSQQALLGIVSHFIDSAGFQRHKLLALKRIIGPHSGANIAPLVIEVINTFDIKKAGFFTLDNAIVNDTCLDYLFSDHLHLFPSPPVFTDVTTVRLRCWGHIINLAAKAFLEPSEQSRLTVPNDEDIIRLSPKEKERLASWLKNGPVAKLSDVVTFIRRSPQRREAFSFQVQHTAANAGADSSADDNPLF
ncbi:hypothetical protein LRP88_02272 [Fusarium phalaenopsidis]